MREHSGTLEAQELQLLENAEALYERYLAVVQLSELAVMSYLGAEQEGAAPIASDIDW